MSGFQIVVLIWLLALTTVVICMVKVVAVLARQELKRAESGDLVAKTLMKRMGA